MPDSTVARHEQHLPCQNGADITPHDTNDLASTSSMLVATVAGACKINLEGGTTVTVQLAAGIPLAVRATRVFATGTAATGIVAFW